MQAWPLFCIRPIVAALTVRPRSSVSSTMNGSLPPSSSTDFLRCLPASEATALPARSLPVRVTPCDERVRDDLLDVGDGQEDVGVDALGHAGVVEALLDGQRGLRVELGVLEQDRVAEHQVRPGHPDHLVQRVVPRLDGEDDADRLVLDDRLALHAPRSAAARGSAGRSSRSSRGCWRPAAPRRPPPGCACPSRGSPGRRTRPCARASARRRGRRSARAPRPDGGATRRKAACARSIDAVDLAGLEEGELLLGLPGVGVHRRVGAGAGVAGGLRLLGRGFCVAVTPVILVSRTSCPSRPLPGPAAATHERPLSPPRPRVGPTPSTGEERHVRSLRREP